jgi:Amidohydrolase
MYHGHDELQSMMFGYATETATHLLRIIYSGVFDTFPAAKVVIGHLGEMIPYHAWRIQHCFEPSPRNDKVKLRLQDYLDQNMWITTSGNYSTVALQCAIETTGTDRIMFSVDYPYENMDQAANWIETCNISEDDRSKIAHRNAQKLLKLRQLPARPEPGQAAWAPGGATRLCLSPQARGSADGCSLCPAASSPGIPAGQGRNCGCQHAVARSWSQPPFVSELA